MLDTDRWHRRRRQREHLLFVSNRRPHYSGHTGSSLRHPAGPTHVTPNHGRRVIGRVAAAHLSTVHVYGPIYRVMSDARVCAADNRGPAAA